jgi:hypothetical protein
MFINLITHDFAEFLTFGGSSFSNSADASGLISHNLSKSADKCIFILSGLAKIIFTLFKSSVTDDHPSSDSILFCKFDKNLCCLNVLHA